MQTSKKPPLGITPRYIWEAKRAIDILEGVKRFSESYQSIPVEWIEEYNTYVGQEKVRAFLVPIDTDPSAKEKEARIPFEVFETFAELQSIDLDKLSWNQTKSLLQAFENERINETDRYHRAIAANIEKYERNRSGYYWDGETN